MAVSAEFLNEAANYVHSVAHKWDFIGIKLYQGNLVQSLRYSEKSAAQKLTEILQGWLNGPKAPGDDLAAWMELVSALRSPAVNLGAMARKIEEAHVRTLEQVVQQSSQAQAMVTGRAGHVIRDSDSSAPGMNYQDVIRKQREQELIRWPDNVNDAVRDQPHSATSSHQPSQKVNVTSYGTFSGQGAVVPDAPHYRHGNQQHGHQHVQTSGGVYPANVEPRTELVLNTPTSSVPTGGRFVHTDNTHAVLSSPSQSTPSGSSRGYSLASSRTASSTGGVDRVSPPPEIQELLDKRMSVDDPKDRRCLLQLAKRLPKWRYFGLYLNLPESTLDEMERTGADADDKAVSMLFRWVKESQTGTRATLVKCLEEAECFELMHELRSTGSIKPRDPVK